MTKKELEQTLDIQLDPNIDKLTHLSPVLNYVMLYYVHTNQLKKGV